MHIYYLAAFYTSDELWRLRQPKMHPMRKGSTVRQPKIHPLRKGYTQYLMPRFSVAYR
jgi:hypothetical protein